MFIHGLLHWSVTHKTRTYNQVRGGLPLRSSQRAALNSVIKAPKRNIQDWKWNNNHLLSAAFWIFILHSSGTEQSVIIYFVFNDMLPYDTVELGVSNQCVLCVWTSFRGGNYRFIPFFSCLRTTHTHTQNQNGDTFT